MTTALRRFKAYRGTLPDGAPVVFYLSGEREPFILAPPALTLKDIPLDALADVTPIPGVHPALLVLRFVDRSVRRLVAVDVTKPIGSHQAREILTRAARALERWQAPMDHALERDNETCRRWWWISFATTSAFLGAAIVRAADARGALLTAHRLKINPGGSADVGALPADLVPDTAWRNRLLSRGEALELKGMLEARAAARGAATGGCN